MTYTPTKGKPLIAVCGGLGMQGSSVVKFLLEDDFFSVRILTRNPHSASAKNMARRGVEVVQADFDDADSLRRAFEGAYGVFGMTNFFDCGEERERQQGLNMVDAAKDMGVQHFVWSSCEHTEFNIPTFETKADVNDYLKASGIPRTSILPTFYYSNVFLFGLDRKRPDGTYYMPWIYPTDCPFPAFDVADMGAFVTAAFMDPEEWIDKDMPICSEYISPRQLHQIFEDITGTEIKTPEVSYEDFEAMKDMPNPYDLWRNMKYFQMNGTTCRDAALSRRIYPRLSNWRQFVIRNFTEPPKQTLEIPMTVDVTFQEHDEVNHDANHTTSTISAY